MFSLMRNLYFTVNYNSCITHKIKTATIIIILIIITDVFLKIVNFLYFLFSNDDNVYYYISRQTFFPS